MTSVIQAMAFSGRSLLSIGLLALSSAVVAGEKVDKTLQTSDAPFVEVEHMNGSADIIGWDKAEIRVTGELGEQTEEFIFEKNGNAVVIKVETRRRNRDWRDWASHDGDELTIYVPHGAQVTYETINADVTLTDLTHSVRTDVVNGDIRARSLAGRVKLEAVNGDITLEDVSGDINVETVNGDISGNHTGDSDARFDSVNGDIDVITSSPDVGVETVNGDIELTMQAVSELRIETVNGRVDASLTLNNNGDVRASSVGGSLNLAFQPNVSARFNIEAHAGGNIINDLTSDKMQKAKYGPSRWLKFANQGGDASVDISTVSGRVKLTTHRQ
ncbi:hypothetical protein OCL06_08470 [Alteromonas sp. ASW11-19]|uniref:DUF4097 domain-containing protein n=1 Tax=Alteromonas salexigens TaxID=2982530 RepID=A0ABT2VMT9_9ALTE|nr:DUF4097 family beta strand repeat-containing protein [Alteromonas salexigens]MCU7554632.1 hypothetical protein [Alteromonas salexigens]